VGYASIRFAPIRSQWTDAEDFTPDLGPEHRDKVMRIEARLGSVALVSAPADVNTAVEWMRSNEHQPEWAGGRQLDEWAGIVSR
jgi:hypothetical protein